jgi:hypothetical protein
MIRKGTPVYSINSIKPEYSAFHFSSGLWIALGIRVLFLRLLQKRFMGGFYRTDPATSNVFGKTILAQLPEKNTFIPKAHQLLDYFMLNRSLLRVLESLFGTGLHCVPCSQNCMPSYIPCWAH